VPCTVQHQHQTATDLVPQSSVGLPPIPRFAQPDGKGIAAASGVTGDKLPDEKHISFADFPASIAQTVAHDKEDTPVQLNVRRNVSKNHDPMVIWRHIGPVRVAFGSPPARSTCRACASMALAGIPAPFGHQRNRP
jgi:hypothetical protein